MEKTPDDVLQQELLKEKADVLGRAGRSVERALARLQRLETVIERNISKLGQLDDDRHRKGAPDASPQRKQIVSDLNNEIKHFNKLREHAQLRYHYLIVTREAMGLRRHHRVEEIYPIPPKKKQIQEN